MNRPQLDAKNAPPLDPSLYALDAESLTFFKSVTGIRGDNELKEHILKVQAQAYAVVPYPFIRSFGFTKSKISQMPMYREVLKLGQQREGALFLDVGCGFGNDVRKVVRDGFPVKQVVATDLKSELWDLGHVLFRDNQESFPATFVAGDALNPAFLSRGSGPSNVNLSNVRTLNDLRGHVSVVWVASLFHIFSEKDQHQLAHALGSLLSPKSGSVIFGTHMALPNKGSVTVNHADKDFKVFSHDADSWKEMWLGSSTGSSDAAVFPPGSVKVESKLVQAQERTATGKELLFLVWSVTRL